MDLGQTVAAILQTSFVVLFVAVLTPFRFSQKKTWCILGCGGAVLLVTAGILAALYGTGFLAVYGFLYISAPLFLGTYLLSQARGIRFVFVILTALIFHQIISKLLMVFRVFQGGFTPLYFFLNLLGFGALLLGGYIFRPDFHKIIFAYRNEFICLCPILILLLAISWLTSPILGHAVDSDLLLATAVIDTLIVLLYVYIAVSFRSLSKRLDSEQVALSLRLQMEEAQHHIDLLHATQERAALYRHDLHHHLLLIHGFLDNDQPEQLRAYLADVEQALDETAPVHYCQNEAANLLLHSFSAKAAAAGVRLDADVQMPLSLPLNNAELCALLSNALENAIAAAAQMENDAEKNVRLLVRLTDGKLLIQVQNPYVGTVRMENGLPQSHPPGHGFGVRSMERIVKKYGGLSTYEAQNGMFTVRFAV